MSLPTGKQRGQVSPNVRESGKFLFVESGNLGWNTALGIRNLMSTEKDLESSNWIPESTLWNPESKTVSDIPLHGLVVRALELQSGGPKFSPRPCH